MDCPIPSNRAPFTFDEVAEALNSPAHSGHFERALGVATDTRAEVAGKLFVALRGEHFDGHDFVTQALQRGACAAIVDREVAAPVGACVYRVPSALLALGQLARLHRRRWSGRLVAIGGSAGKTTTRVAATSLLSTLCGEAVHSTAGNQNNAVGVPMTLLGLEPSHQVAVLEIGTNHTGEVSQLGQIAEPNVALVTLIAMEHSEGLGSLDSIEREEGDLFRSLPPSGLAIGNADDSRIVRQLASSSIADQITYGSSRQAGYRIVGREALATDRQLITIERHPRLGGKRLTVKTHLVGLAGALASTAAVALGDQLFHLFDSGQVGAALDLEAKGEFGRLQVRERDDGTVVIDDSYNANPASMESSIAFARQLAEARHARLLLFLGEMRELGQMSAQAHESMAERVGPTDCAVVVGDQFRPFLDRAKSLGVGCEWYPDSRSAALRVDQLIQEGDVILVKGSRGARMERVVHAIMPQKGGCS